jgi:hypothetical protein
MIKRRRAKIDQITNRMTQLFFFKARHEFLGNEREKSEKRKKIKKNLKKNRT